MLLLVGHRQYWEWRGALDASGAAGVSVLDRLGAGTGSNPGAAASVTSPAGAALGTGATGSAAAFGTAGSAQIISGG